MGHESTGETPTVLLIHAQSPHAAALKEEFPHWEWVEAPVRTFPDLPELASEQPPHAIIVCGAQDRAESGFLCCKRIRQDRALDGIPLLLMVDRYHIQVGNAVKRMPDAHFLLTPADGAALKERLREIGHALS